MLQVVFVSPCLSFSTCTVSSHILTVTVTHVVDSRSQWHLPCWNIPFQSSQVSQLRYHHRCHFLDVSCFSKNKLKQTIHLMQTPLQRTNVCCSWHMFSVAEETHTARTCNLQRGPSSGPGIQPRFLFAVKQERYSLCHAALRQSESAQTNIQNWNDSSS